MGVLTPPGLRSSLDDLPSAVPWLNGSKSPSAWWKRLAVFLLVGAAACLLVFREVTRPAHVQASCVAVNSSRPLPPFKRLTKEQVAASVVKAGDYPNARRYAYATILTASSSTADTPYEDDKYFIAMRMLTFQIVHDRATRSYSSIPLIVMVTPDVSQEKQQRLLRDGATVIPVDYVTEGGGWVSPGSTDWAAMFTKFRAWELTEYDKILFLDADVILRQTLDTLFEERNAAPVKTIANYRPEQVHTDEGPLPAEYLMASIPEAGQHHSYPAKPSDWYYPDRMNGGFLLLRPDATLFRHYLAIASIPNRFPSIFMDQGLLNYAHRFDGPMPFRILPTEYTTVNVDHVDIDGPFGVASIHQKWFQAPQDYPELKRWMESVRWRMEGFYQGQDEINGVEPGKFKLGKWHFSVGNY
ncbi:hypothetical protein MRB53_037510 [Persea americana]|nr:hypothetical protein MRB53_037510 [Persea americana]